VLRFAPDRTVPAVCELPLRAACSRSGTPQAGGKGRRNQRVRVNANAKRSCSPAAMSSRRRTSVHLLAEALAADPLVLMAAHASRGTRMRRPRRRSFILCCGSCTMRCPFGVRRLGESSPSGERCLDPGLPASIHCDGADGGDRDERVGGLR